MKRSSKPEKFLTQDESFAIKNAIAEAEKNTTAEIKFILCRHCWRNLRKKTVKVFQQFGLDQTRDRNCILIMLVIANREFVIYGDSGINEKVGDDFWEAEKDIMAKAFKENRFGEGIAGAVKNIGEKLTQFFPVIPGEENVNEISDEVGHVE